MSGCEKRKGVIELIGPEGDDSHEIRPGGLLHDGYPTCKAVPFWPISMPEWEKGCLVWQPGTGPSMTSLSTLP